MTANWRESGRMEPAVPLTEPSISKNVFEIESKVPLEIR